LAERPSVSTKVNCFIALVQFLAHRLLRRGYALCSVPEGVTLIIPWRKSARVNKLHCSTFGGSNGRVQRVRNDLDHRFQRLDPLLAIPGMNVLSRLAEQIASTISFAAGELSGRTLLRDGANKTTSSDRAGYLQNITPSLSSVLRERR
jgi:hypothetical protein